MFVDRLSRTAWRLARIGLASSAALILVGGFLAGPARHLSDSLVLVGFGVLVPSVALAWAGIRHATASPTVLTSQESVR